MYTLKSIAKRGANLAGVCNGGFVSRSVGSAGIRRRIESTDRAQLDAIKFIPRMG